MRRVKRETNISIRVSDDEYAMLEELQRAEGLPFTAVIRRLVREAYRKLEPAPTSPRQRAHG